MKRWIWVALAIFIANAAFFHWRTAEGPVGAGLADLRPTPLGFQTPAAPLQTPEGQVVRLSDWEGEVTLVAFWATWCPICRHEMPQLNRLAPDWAAKGINVLPVSLDRHPHSMALIEDWYRRHQITDLPILHDREARFAGTVTATATPTTLIVDRSGEVVASVIGRTDWSDPAISAYLTQLAKAETTEDARALLPR